ncbi:MAG: hypothetical protein LAT64_07745 [Phycisphaerales bacterium]|nr:hypothetical protein [Planctomycetota bacterium]MCH8508648.1 hypothetical protein [Phycisphaerales bacterium]
MSKAEHWDLARHEWQLDYVEIIYDEDDKDGYSPEQCPCGHYPISELCWLRNTENGHSTFVGNVCVRKFMDIPADTVAAGIKRIVKNQEKALNVEAGKFAYDKKWINDWELNFCLNTARKRRLSASQLAKRIQINARVIAEVRKDKQLRRGGNTS